MGITFDKLINEFRTFKLRNITAHGYRDIRFTVSLTPDDYHHMTDTAPRGYYVSDRPEIDGCPIVIDNTKASHMKVRCPDNSVDRVYL